MPGTLPLSRRTEGAACISPRGQETHFHRVDTAYRQNVGGARRSADRDARVSNGDHSYALRNWRLFPKGGPRRRRRCEVGGGRGRGRREGTEKREKGPGLPTPDQAERHNVTHNPSWYPACLAGKARGRLQQRAKDDEPRRVSEVVFDYAFLGSEGEEVTIPVLVARDRGRQPISARVVPPKCLAHEHGGEGARAGHPQARLLRGLAQMRQRAGVEQPPAGGEEAPEGACGARELRRGRHPSERCCGAICSNTR